jgi:cobalt/nickel transport system ATP-binding protein
MSPVPEGRVPDLCCRQLGFVYPDQRRVLQGIELQVQPGERIAVIGPNGAGKTTWFSLLCGLLPPTEGQIEWFGQPLRAGTFNPAVTLVFQQPEEQLFCPTVREDVGFGPQNMGLTPAEIEARVQAALRSVDALALADRLVHHLSGGEKRSVALAGALAMHPRVLLLDEPSAGLDIRHRRRLIQWLQALPQTLMIAAHDLEFLLETCSRAIVLDAGRIMADGPIRTILGDAALMAAHGQEKPHSLQPHAEAHHPFSRNCI